MSRQFSQYQTIAPVPPGFEDDPLKFAGSLHIVATESGLVSWTVGRVDQVSKRMVFSWGGTFLPICGTGVHPAELLLQAAQMNLDESLNGTL